MEDIKKAKNSKNIKKKKNYFEIIFISVSILMFLLLIFSIQWLKESLYTAKDQVTLEFINDYNSGLISEDVNDPLVGVKNSVLEEELKSPIDNNNDPFIGSKDAKVKIFYFSDFSCPFCLEQENIVKNIYEKFSQDVRIIWKDYPDFNSLEDFSFQAAKAARCAHEQGEFWDYNQLLYKEGDKFPISQGKLFVNLAENLRLNIDNFNNCLLSSRTNNAIMSNVLEAEELGIVGIPYIYINDIGMIADINEEELENIVEIELKK